MPTATSVRTRRRFLQALAATATWPLLAPRAAADGAPVDTLVAAWDAPRGSQVGMVEVTGRARPAARVACALDVPTRAHAITRDAGGDVLVVARRPGDWMVRLRLDHRSRRLHAHAWQWIEPDRAFNGHAIATPDGRLVLSTETDQATGAGIVGVRDAGTLAKIDEWPTHGRDPHELLWVEHRGRAHVAVANGGIATLPETGRAKHDLPAMDPSLVMLDAADGALAGQWRLTDPRLGTRHLARRDGVIAIALQAEHDDPDVRKHAAVLALFDGRQLVPITAPQSLAGYGGGVAALADGFAVSCPRAGGVARYAPDGTWRGFTALADACALAADGNAILAGGASSMIRSTASGDRLMRIGSGVTLDNHWLVVDA